MNRFQDVTVKHTNNSTLLLMHQIPKTEKYKISQQLLSFQVVTMQKYVFKIILHYSWLESRSNMVIMEVFQGNGTEKKLVLEEKFWYLINFQRVCPYFYLSIHLSEKVLVIPVSSESWLASFPLGSKLLSILLRTYWTVEGL